MSSRKVRRSAFALALTAAFAFLPPLAAGSHRAAPPATAGLAPGGDGGWSFPGELWNLLTALWGGAGAKIDGNG